MYCVVANRDEVIGPFSSLDKVGAWLDNFYRNYLEIDMDDMGMSPWEEVKSDTDVYDWAEPLIDNECILSIVEMDSPSNYS